jgi:hypothetical protein
MALEVQIDQGEPRWLAALALLAIGGIVMALPDSLTLGPRWLVLVLVGGLLVPTVISHRRGHHTLNHVLGLGVNGLVTVAMVGSLALLVKALPTRQETPEALLRSAAALWVTNVLVFASWYWRLDAGGPHQRERRPGHVDGAFLFPQMTMDATAKAAAGESAWSPGFVDYLFLAFNTSTALSPTDAPVLSPWAKLLMMLQAMISLTIVVLLAARAVNIL